MSRINSWILSMIETTLKWKLGGNTGVIIPIVSGGFPFWWNYYSENVWNYKSITISCFRLQSFDRTKDIFFHLWRWPACFMFRVRHWCSRQLCLTSARISKVFDMDSTPEFAYNESKDLSNVRLSYFYVFGEMSPTVDGTRTVSPLLS